MHDCKTRVVQSATSNNLVAGSQSRCNRKAYKSLSRVGGRFNRLLLAWRLHYRWEVRST